MTCGESSVYYPASIGGDCRLRLTRDHGNRDSVLPVLQRLEGHVSSLWRCRRYHLVGLSEISASARWLLVCAMAAAGPPGIILLHVRLRIHAATKNFPPYHCRDGGGGRRVGGVESGARPSERVFLLAGDRIVGGLLRNMFAVWPRATEGIGICRDTATRAKHRFEFMKYLALLFAISVAGFAQVPYQHPVAPPEPRRFNAPQLPGAHGLQKLTPKNKIAGPASGQRGAGVPKRGKKPGISRGRH
jgi:hypothetical protein